MLDPKSSEFARSLIKNYYLQMQESSPKSMEKREFGFGDFERKIVYRHYSFKDWKALKAYFVNNSPPFVSMSSAYYRRPDGRPMEAKGWLGSELVFDLDASDLNLPCKNEHGSSWVCDKCLFEVKRETIKLIEDFLVPDFGFDKSEMLINFSGNRGYHIHIDSKAVLELDSNARRSMSNYITGNNMDVDSFLPALGLRGVRLEGPKPTDYGWGGKLARGAINALNAGAQELMSLGIDKQTANMLSRKRAEVILGISTGNWDKVKIPHKEEFWRKILASIAVRQSDSIDKNVSADANHLIRMPETLHGDTGLISKKISSASALESFDPMKDAIAFKSGTAKVKISSAPKLEIANTELAATKDATTELETAAAAYLVLKRVATIV